MSTQELTVSDTVSLPQERQARELAASIKLEDPALSVSYGAETMQNISRFADDLLQRVRAKDAGEVGQTLTNLLGEVKSLDISAIGGAKKGFLESLPLIGSLFNSASRAMAKFNTVADQVQGVSDKLEQAMAGLLHDVQVLEALYDHNKQFHDDLSMYIEAGKLRLEEARNKELPRLKAEAEASADTMAAQKVRDFAEQINRFERRLHDLQLSRTITVQTAPQIRMIQSNNQTLAEKIQTSILTTIPIWKSQVVLALSLQGQQSAAKLQKDVADATNEMLRKNADLLQQSTVETAKQVERSVVDIETLREVHNKLLNTIEETLRIAQEGREKRAATEKELVAMEEDMRAKLTSLAVKKADAALKAAEGKSALPENRS